MVLVAAWGNRSWDQICDYGNSLYVLVKEAGGAEMGYLATSSQKNSSQGSLSQRPTRSPGVQTPLFHHAVVKIRKV